MAHFVTTVMTQSMAFSPYKKPFEERLTRWEAQLSLVSEVIDEWLALQRAWMYLEPIFSSPDILQQLPQEGKRYSSVDRIWRKVSRANQQTHAPASKDHTQSMPRCVVGIVWGL